MEEKKEKKQEKPSKEGPITRDMNIVKMVQKHPETAGVLMKYGFHCLGCVAAQFETIGEGAEAHGIDVAKLVEDLNKAVKEKKEKKE